MPQELLIQVTPETAANESLLKDHVGKLLKVANSEIQHITILKRSIDARQKAIKINLKLTVYMQGDVFQEQQIQLPDYPNVANEQEIIVVGAGPAGLSFATTAARRGHHVTLFEKSQDIGGQFNLAKKIPGKSEFYETLRYFRVRNFSLFWTISFLVLTYL